jgi:hypothetical protein
MANQDALFTSGRIGNVIFYRVNGKGYARTAPRKYKQSKGTKQSAKDFGHVAQLSKILRKSLSPTLPNYSNRETMYKMSAALRKWLNEGKSLEETIAIEKPEFNDKALFGERFKKELLIDFNTRGKVIITVPRLKIPDDIDAPPNTLYIRLDIAVAGCMLELPAATDAASASIKINYKEGRMDAIQEELKFKCKAGSINVVASSLHYFTRQDGREQENVDDRWTPVAIVAGTIV